MDKLKSKFERDLKGKLLAKTTGHTKEESILLKAFKYYDGQKTGKCNIDQFLQALTQISVLSFKDEEFDQIFNYYSNGKELLDYKHFIGVLFNNASLKKEEEEEKNEQEPEGSKQENNENEEQPDPIEGIIMKVRNKLSQRGLNNLISIESGFRNIDPENEQVINYETFKKACADFNFELNEDETKELFEAFEKETSGSINYDELIRVLRGELSEKRSELVQKVFSEIDEDNKGALTLEELFGKYNPKGSLEYIYDKEPEDEAMRTFVNTFKTNHIYLNGEDGADKPVDIDEFADYYESVSLMIPDDEVFREVLLKSWKLTPLENPQEVVEQPKTETQEEQMSENKQEQNIQEPERQVEPPKEEEAKEENKETNEIKSQPPEQESEAPKEKENEAENQQIEQEQEQESHEPEQNKDMSVNKNEEVSKEPEMSEQEKKDREIRKDLLNEGNLENFRNTLGGKGIVSVINFLNQLRQYDRKGNKELSYNDFADAIYNSNINISEKDVKDLFNDFAKNKSTINYAEFLTALQGEMVPRRLNIVKEAFKRLDTEQCEVINLSDIKTIFNCKNNPLVKEGYVNEEDFYNGFMETFQTHHNIFRSAKIKKVNLEEFIDYYKYYSITIEDDYLFEDMVIASWKLSKPKKTQAGLKDNVKSLLVNTNEEKPTEEEMTKNISLVGSNKRAKKYFPPATGQVPYGTDEKVTDYSNPLHPKGDLNGIRLNKNEDPLTYFRKRLIARGPRGIMSLRRTFMLYDENKNKRLCEKEFHKYITDYRLTLPPEDESKLFKSFDKNNSGDIDYSEFVQAIVGQMNDYRRSIVERVFEKLDKENKGVVSFETIRNGYNATKHPEVLNGSRNSEEILSRFIDLFEYNFNLLDPNKNNEEVTLEEFLKFYNYISMLFDDDKYFENVMARVWGLGNLENYAKGKNKKRGIY